VLNAGLVTPYICGFAESHSSDGGPKMKLAHISILNRISESSDRRNHQYLCGCKCNDDAPEVNTQWVRNKISLFSSPSTLLSKSISRVPASLPTAA
jgi:hypothetical protein